MQIQIDEYRVRGAGDKVRRVGDDTQQFVEQIASQMTSNLNCNGCLSSMSTLRQVVKDLEGRSRGLASTSQTLGGNVVQAAANHIANEYAQSRNMKAFSPSIEAIGGN